MTSEIFGTRQSFKYYTDYICEQFASVNVIHKNYEGAFSMVVFWTITQIMSFVMPYLISRIQAKKMSPVLNSD